jgi:uncharacterized protein YkwD
MLRLGAAAVGPRLLVLACAAWGLSVLPAPAGSAEKPGAAARAAEDRQLDAALQRLIDRGAALYNGGDPAGCCHLWEGALTALRPLLGHRPAWHKAIDRGLAGAGRAAGPEDRAFALRAVLDRIRADLAPRRAKASPGGAPADTGGGLSRDERAVLDLTNREREKAGLGPLQVSARLVRAARSHSANMARQGQLGHLLDGKGPGERLQDVGYAHTGWGENCAAGQRTAAEAVRSWMSSEGHRANILNPAFAEIGIGIAPGEGGGNYFTQLFGTPWPR